MFYKALLSVVIVLCGHSPWPRKKANTVNLYNEMWHMFEKQIVWCTLVIVTARSNAPIAHSETPTYSYTSLIRFAHSTFNNIHKTAPALSLTGQLRRRQTEGSFMEDKTAPVHSWNKGEWGVVVPWGCFWVYLHVCSNQSSLAATISKLPFPDMWTQHQ